MVTGGWPLTPKRAWPPAMVRTPRSPGARNGTRPGGIGNPNRLGEPWAPQGPGRRWGCVGLGPLSLGACGPRLCRPSDASYQQAPDCSRDARARAWACVSGEVKEQRLVVRSPTGPVRQLGLLCGWIAHLTTLCALSCLCRPDGRLRSPPRPWGEGYCIVPPVARSGT
jgi:hypothetical protein